MILLANGKVITRDSEGAGYLPDGGVVTDGGELYTLGSSGADTFEYAVSRLDKDKENPLKSAKRFGCQSGQYYADIDGTAVSISEEDFQKLLSENPFEFGQSWKENKMYLLK